MNAIAGSIASAVEEQGSRPRNPPAAVQRRRTGTQDVMQTIAVVRRVRPVDAARRWS